MEPYREKAWDCLTESERNALFLNLSQGLSTREAGEIMKITHYKYLELKARAEKFFKLFSDYFQIHPTLIRPELYLPDNFRDYLIGSMLKRLPKEEALLYAGDSSWHLRTVKYNSVEKWVNILRESEDKWDRDLYALIVEFDRWNNYRILPRSCQAPSAYKRRSQRKAKTYLMYLHRIPDFKIRALVDMYWRAGKDRYYVVFLSPKFPGGYTICPILKRKEIVDEITKMKIYIFDDYDIADEFATLVRYYFESTATRRDGMKFWNKYQKNVELAINYKYINNIDFCCDVLDQAYKLKRKKTSKLIAERRARENKNE